MDYTVNSTTEENTGAVVASFFPAGYQGTYVDVGAGYPVYYSNSHYFRELGWQIIAVEPQPLMCQAFRQMGYEVLEYACAAIDKGEVDFQILDNTQGLAGSAFKVLDDHPPESIRTIKVQAYTLDTLLARHYPKLTRIDVLDIDVEYYELEVLAGFDIELWRPRVLVIENLPNSGAWRNLNYERLHKYYRRHGYRIAAVAGFNEIAVKI